MLEALHGIIAELAAGHALETSLASTLDALRIVLGANEAGIWLGASSAMVRAWGLGRHRSLPPSYAQSWPAKRPSHQA